MEEIKHTNLDDEKRKKAIMSKKAKQKNLIKGYKTRVKILVNMVK